MKRCLLQVVALLLLTSAAAYAQTTVTGKVTSAADGSAVPGASVIVKGTSTGTTTDANGQYTITTPGGSNDVLVISFIGFATQEVSIQNRTIIDVTLSEDVTALSEVVVTALGIEKSMKAVGYSLTEVDGSKFTQSRELNLGNALSGQIAGVSVAGVATGPGGSSRVTIRGNSSLTGNNQPLYVIDGIPYDNTNQGASGQWGGADYGDGLTNISPDNIASIQVLKGVAATALYGYRGGNGVILIQTKNGSKTKGLGIEFNNNMTFNNVVDEREYQYKYGQGTLGNMPTSQLEALNAGNMSWGALLDGSTAVNFLGNEYSYVAQRDNFDNFYRTGVSNQASIAVTSNGEFGSFRLGLTDMHTKSPVPYSGMKQQGVSLNSMMNITKKLQASITANYVFEEVNNRASFSDAPGSVVAGPLYLPTSFDIRWLKPRVKADGSELQPGADIYFNNPYFVAYNYQNQTNRNRLTGSIMLKYSFTDWLSLSGQVTRDGYIYDQKSVLPTGTGYQKGGSLTQWKKDFHELNANFMVEFNKMFGDFSVRANLGGNTQDNVWERGGVDGVGPFTIDYFYDVNNVALRPFKYEYAHYRVNSLYGSADLGYKNFLFLTLTARNDWFSTLSTDSNDYLYPSVSSSFVFSDAFELPDAISFGKLRASFGQSSNGTTPYRNLLTYGLQGYTISGQTLGYINQTDIPNNALKPIQIQETEVGLNMQFLDNRVGFDVAYYSKNTKDDILNVTISPTSGYPGLVTNIGELRNRGVEIMLTGTPVKTDDFSWDLSFNIAKNNNKVMALAPGLERVTVDGAFPRWGNGVAIQQIVGMPFAQIVGYKYLRDADGNKVFGDDGMPLRSSAVEPLGSGVYDVTGGFTNNFSYKSFHLSVLFDFKFGAKIYSGTNLLLYNNGLHQETLKGRDGGVVGVGVNEAGEVNDVAVDAQTYYQALSTGASHVGEEFVYDASFIKLRSISFGYTVPRAFLGNFFIKEASISVFARNVATLKKHTPNLDPEANLNTTNAQGLELSGFPYQRSLGFNVNLKF